MPVSLGNKAIWAQEIPLVWVTAIYYLFDAFYRYYCV